MTDFEQSFGPVHVLFRNDVLDIDLGACRRVWKLRNDGLSTVFFGKEENLLTEAGEHPDWQVCICKGPAELLSFQCRLHPADYRSGEYVETLLVFRYPQAKLLLQYEIDCYPGASGFRTQISFRSEVPIPESGPSPEKDRLTSVLRGYTESLPLQPEKFCRLAFGYACDSQHRYNLESPILSEIRADAKPVRTTENYESSNGLILTDSSGRSITLIKESHKCSNCPGIDTGSFVIHTRDVRCTGFGFSEGSPYWLSDKKFHPAWANWCLYSTDGEKGMRETLKRFDRLRYPFREKRDMLIAANLWGSRGGGEFSRSAAEEQNLLREVDSCADLGIDLLQVDDGWEFDPDKVDHFHCDWTPSKIRFPHGWALLRQTAEKKGMKLGLWFPEFADADKILQNIREGGFKRIKLDFICFTHRNQIDVLLEKADRITKNFPEDTGVNWDITEIMPRLGFYFGRDFGNIFLQNNENSTPGGTYMSYIGYDPEVTLRQVWMLGRYMNLNQVQITVQRIADSPNGKDYPQDYAFAIAMMGIPLFFTETCRFNDAERNLLRPLIAAYRKYRSEILRGYVIPVGEEPFGCSWTGFQCKTGPGKGFLLLFREKNAEASAGYFRLEDVCGKLHLEALYNGNDSELEPDDQGQYVIQDMNKASFALYRYRSAEK